MPRDTERYGIFRHSDEFPDSKRAPLIASLTCEKIDQQKVFELTQGINWLQEQGHHVKGHIRVSSRNEERRVREEILGSKSYSAESQLVEVSTSAAKGKVVYLLGANDWQSFAGSMSSNTPHIRMICTQSLFSVSGTIDAPRQSQGDGPQQRVERAVKSTSNDSVSSWRSSGRSTTLPSQGSLVSGSPFSSVPTPARQRQPRDLFSRDPELDIFNAQKVKLQECADQLDKEIEAKRGSCCFSFFRQKKTDKEIKRDVLQGLCDTSNAVYSSRLENRDLKEVVKAVADKESRSKEEIEAIVTKGRRSHRTKDVLEETNILPSSSFSR